MPTDSRQAHDLLMPSPDAAERLVNERRAMFRKVLADWSVDLLRLRRHGGGFRETGGSGTEAACPRRAA